VRGMNRNGSARPVQAHSAAAPVTCQTSLDVSEAQVTQVTSGSDTSREG